MTVLKPADQLRKPGSCGKVYGGIEVKLVREDGTEADVGEPGSCSSAPAWRWTGTTAPTSSSPS